MTPDFLRDGYAIYEASDQISEWAAAALPLARVAVNDPQLRKDWLRCEGTWFVGVDALPTGPNGEVGQVPLAGPVIDHLSAYLPYQSPLHRAQLSIVFPGYPKPREGESEAAFRYRLNRDAAHVDGLHAVGDNRQRRVHEHHAFLLGLPLTDCSANASPLVVWKGSHIIIGQFLRDKLQGLAPERWHEVDLTDAYHAARRKCFELCERTELPVKPGQALVMHRHVLHGIAPWGDDARAPEDGRMIAYFRPEVSGDRAVWLLAD